MANRGAKKGGGEMASTFPLGKGRQLGNAPYE